MKISVSVFLGLIIAVLAASCSKEVSKTTGWALNDSKNGGFQSQPDYKGQETGPGLVLVEGGAFMMGRVEQDVPYNFNNQPRNVTVSSFYIDETEVRNIDYREYLYWLSRVFFASYPEVYKKALPDTLVWRRRLAYNEPYVETYFRHPAYKNYPVVGVSWTQANNYCEWRTDRVNEQTLIQKGILEVNPNQTNEDNFNTNAYLYGQYDGVDGKNFLKHPMTGEKRRTSMEDGILLPKYELPTEAQWEYAALGLIGNSADERIFNRKLYPWNGHYTRNDTKNYRGMMNANFMRGKGDLMGVAGALNDNASIPSEVDAYWPNDFGLFCMAGNVSEWVRDVYRPESSLDVDEFNPYRGNVYRTLLTDEEGGIADKDSLGRLKTREVSDAEAVDRWNYKRADNINYLDGDVESSIIEGGKWLEATKEKGSERMYKSARGKEKEVGGNIGTKLTTLVSDKSHVYKGGSWRDRAYWLGPGTRRFFDEDDSRDDIGFRCSMVRVGSPSGNK